MSTECLNVQTKRVRRGPATSSYRGRCIQSARRKRGERKTATWQCLLPSSDRGYEETWRYVCARWNKTGRTLHSGSSCLTTHDRHVVRRCKLLTDRHVKGGRILSTVNCPTLLEPPCCVPFSYPFFRNIFTFGALWRPLTSPLSLPPSPHTPPSIQLLEVWRESLEQT